MVEPMVSTLESKLTEEEKQELVNFPPATTFVPATPEQFALRLAMAKKMVAFFADNDPAMTPELRAIYDQYPMWGFYEDALMEGCEWGAGLPRRAFGVCFFENEAQTMKKPGLEMCTAHTPWQPESICQIPADLVMRVDEWSEKSKAALATFPYPGIFLDPLGFLLPMDRHAPE